MQEPLAPSSLSWYTVFREWGGGLGAGVEQAWVETLGLGSGMAVGTFGCYPAPLWQRWRVGVMTGVSMCPKPLTLLSQTQTEMIPFTFY